MIPRVLMLGKPMFINPEYLAWFKTIVDFRVLPVTNRNEALAQMPGFVAENGPFDVLICPMNRVPFQPYAKALYEPLLPSLKLVSCPCGGYDDHPVEWLTEKGVWFSNTVNGTSESTAEMALFLTLAVVRNTSVAERQARAGLWTQGLGLSREPSGMTLGIIGMGSIGQYLAKKARVFNLNIIYYNRKRLPPSIEAECSAIYTPSMYSLLASSDIVSVHVPATPKTTNLISAREFATMRPGSFFINTSRGATVDEVALIAALESGHLERAGLDVYANEPYIHPYFQSSDKVVLQPHMGGRTELSFWKAVREGFDNVVAWMKVGKPNSPVNDVSGRA